MAALFDAPEIAALSMAYSDVVRDATACHEGSWLSTAAGKPSGPRVAVQVPEAQWQKLAAAICALTGGEVV